MERQPKPTPEPQLNAPSLEAPVQGVLEGLELPTTRTVTLQGKDGYKFTVEVPIAPVAEAAHAEEPSEGENPADGTTTANDPNQQLLFGTPNTPNAERTLRLVPQPEGNAHNTAEVRGRRARRLARVAVAAAVTGAAVKTGIPHDAAHDAVHQTIAHQAATGFGLMGASRAKRLAPKRNTEASRMNILALNREGQNDVAPTFEPFHYFFKHTFSKTPEAQAAMARELAARFPDPSHGPTGLEKEALTKEVLTPLALEAYASRMDVIHQTNQKNSDTQKGIQDTLDDHIAKGPATRKEEKEWKRADRAKWGIVLTNSHARQFEDLHGADISSKEAYETALAKLTRRTARKSLTRAWKVQEHAAHVKGIGYAELGNNEHNHVHDARIVKAAKAVGRATSVTAKAPFKATRSATKPLRERIFDRHTRSMDEKASRLESEATLHEGLAATTSKSGLISPESLRSLADKKRLRAATLAGKVGARRSIAYARRSVRHP